MKKGKKKATAKKAVTVLELQRLAMRAFARSDRDLSFADRLTNHSVYEDGDLDGDPLLLAVWGEIGRVGNPDCCKEASAVNLMRDIQLRVEHGSFRFIQAMVRRIAAESK